MSDFETQARVVHKSNQIRDEIKNLYEWEKDIKQKEAKRNMSSSEEPFDQSYPIRSSIQMAKPSTSAPTTPHEKPTDKLKRSASNIPNAIEQANEFKTRGNDCVKKAEYQKAIHYYTEAIRLNKSEAVFYTNRALCFLKQSKFTECIDDCTTAISLDGKAVKAYYRRMQAREQMNGDLNVALDDCKTILRIDPNNVEAQRGFERLESLVKSTSTSSSTSTSTSKSMSPKLKPEPIDESPVEQPAWSQFDGKDGYERIDFIKKEPHARSKHALKRIAIADSNSKCTPVPVTNHSKRSENKEPTPAPAIDQTKITSAPAKKQLTNELKQHTVSTPLMIPKNSAQFYKTWTCLNDDEQKFTILQGIYDAEVNKILGAQFNLDILRDIFAILKSHFMNQNRPIANILDGILKNAQMPVVSAMMNADDQNLFKSMLGYMRVRGEDAAKIDQIEKTYDSLISM